MNRLLAIIAIVFAIAFCFVGVPDGAIAMLVVGALSFGLVLVIRREEDDALFLTNLFVVALLVRLLLAAIIFSFDLIEFFGPDAKTYMDVGKLISGIWNGTVDPTTPLARAVLRMNGPGWGMNYFSGMIYWVAGSNLLIGQAICSFFGAATVPVVYMCAKRIYSNREVARYSAIIIALFPSMIVWSSQFLKDGLMIFFLVLTMTMVLEIQKKLSLRSGAILAFSLIAIFSLRFYIFYMVAAAVFGSFVVGFGSSTSTIVRRLAAVIFVGGALAFFGIFQIATDDFGRFATVDRFESSRKWASDEAVSGFVKSGDGDIRTPLGALMVFPVGLTYLLLAPFPWQAVNFRQAVTIPEIFVWWAMLPLAVFGLYYTLRNRLRPAIPVLLFSSMLTVVYALFQGNVGTAYRQRTQIQVFLMIFVAVGWVLFRERRENTEMLRMASRRRINIEN